MTTINERIYQKLGEIAFGTGSAGRERGMRGSWRGNDGQTRH